MNLTPRQAAERRISLSAEFNAASEELGRLKAQKAVKWLDARSKAKTDKEADRMLEATEDGQREIVLVYKCKGLEKEISSLNTYLRLLDSEARNLY